MESTRAATSLLASTIFSQLSMRILFVILCIIGASLGLSSTTSAADVTVKWKDRNTITTDNEGNFTLKTDKRAVISDSVPAEYFSPSSLAESSCPSIISYVSSEWRYYPAVNSTKTEGNEGACGYNKSQYVTVGFSNSRPAASTEDPDPDKEASKDEEALKMLAACPALKDNGGVIAIKTLTDKQYEALKKIVLDDKTPDCDKALKDMKEGALEATDPQGGTEEEKTSCAVDGVGWIICPVVNFMAKIVDGTYTLVEKLLLVEPITTKGTSSSLYEAWGYMRNLANVAFVLAFMVIIYSQITSAGVSNYGIKKLLPKLIMAAILVNISYWLCAIAVDISNIAGSSFKSLFDNIAEISTPKFNEGQFSQNTGEGWEGVAGFILAAGTGIAVTTILGLTVLLPALIAALVAIVTVFLVLTLRQALIILLIVVSPLAFVALLLPNTEEWFKKWRGLFQTLLLMFPIIAFIFGASAFAAEIVMKSSEDFAVQIMGALITILPLAITPVVMKTAGGVLNRFGGFINNPNKGPFDRMKKGAEGYRQNRQDYRKLKAMSGGSTVPGKGVLTRRRARRDAVLGNRKSELNRATSEYIADRAEDSARFRGQLAQGGGEGADMRALAGAVNAKAKLEADEVNAALAVIDNLNLTNQQKADLANGGSVTAANGYQISGGGPGALQTRIAARQAVVAGGDAEQINRVMDGARALNAGNESDAKELTNFADTLGKSSNKPSYVQPVDLENIKQNGIGGVDMGSSTEMIEKAVKDRVYSADKLTTLGRQEAGVISGVAKNMASSADAADVEAVAALQEAAIKAATDVRLAPRLGKQKAIIENFASGDVSTW